jgi:heptosyltransferase-2
MGKILVIRGGAIGDFILTLPVLAAIRTNLPSNNLEVLGYPRIADLAVVGGLADRVESIESRGVAGFFARNGQLDEYYADYFSEFDLIVSFLFDPDGIFEQNVARCSSAQFIAGPHRPDEAKLVHATTCFLKPLERLAIFDADANPQLHINRTENGPASKTKITMATGTWLAIHPGSGSAKKNWPEQHWRILLRQLVDETDCHLLLIGGEAEENRLERLAHALPEGRFVLADRLPLPDLAQLLAMATGFIGHDSGISHLAAAVGRPGILLWGETSVEIWRPPSLQFELIRNPEGLSRIQPVELFEACLSRWLQ